MNEFTLALYCISGALFLVSLTLSIISSWLVHISMVKDNTDVYGWGSYKKFIEEFKKCNWHNEGWNGYSLWDRKMGGQIHASIIQFNNKGMIIRNPYEYYKVNQYIKRYFVENAINVNKKISNYKWQK